MTRIEAMRRTMAYFPGTKVLPPLQQSADGALHACIACGGSTVLADDYGDAWHRRCRLRSVGIDPSTV